jgi:hypothetical protein
VWNESLTPKLLSLAKYNSSYSFIAKKHTLHPSENGADSTIHRISPGISKKSGLCSELFLININGFPERTDIELNLFADIVLLATDDNLRHAMQKRQKDTTLLEQCSTKWRISINLDEIIATLSTRRSHRHTPEVRVFYHSIQEECSSLELYFDLKLLWN